MPRARKWREAGGKPLLRPNRTGVAGTHSRKRTDGLMAEVGRPGYKSGVRVFSSMDVALGRQHHGVEDRRSPCHAARTNERPTVEVADPNADRHLARVSDSPVVTVGL